MIASLNRGKAKALISEGMPYLRVSDLPPIQYGRFFDWTSEADLISVSVKKTLINDCVPYEEYEYWFENIFQSPQVEDEF
ncbi:MAG: hypothetical protein LAT68_11060 [Cyclobacteriaceae bacterium]|nr:hypothetical protein [Cyclobacteriaceae bacterium]MCH8516854.1 hypothetical protein [Cyclobacteriaceae bacterium]